MLIGPWVITQYMASLRDVDLMRRSIMSGLTASDSFDADLEDSPSHMERCAADSSLQPPALTPPNSWTNPVRSPAEVPGPGPASTEEKKADLVAQGDESEEIFEESEPEIR